MDEQEVTTHLLLVSLENIMHDIVALLVGLKNKILYIRTPNLFDGKGYV